MGLVTFKDGRFVWSGRFDERHIPKQAGFLWDSRARAWWTKYHERAAKLARYMDASAREEIERWRREQAETIAASRAADASIDIPAPAGRQYLPFQRAGIAYVLERFARGQKGVLIGDEMGLGKTIQALGVVNARPDFQRVLVVCPASLRLNWAREAERWLIDGRRVQVINGGQPDWDLEKGLWVVNYERLKEVPDAVQFDLVVFDEAHYIKNEKAQRSRRAREIAARARHVLLLTGTPIANRPIELWHPLRVMGASRDFGGFWAFARRYCGAYNNGWGWDFRGASNLEELQAKLRAKWMVRRLKREVLAELPRKIRQVIPLPPDTALKRLIAQEQELRQALERAEELQARLREAEALEDEQAFREALAELEGLKEAFSEMARVRREIGLAKVPVVLQHIRDLLEEEQKIVLFAHHKDVVQALVAGLEEFRPVVVTGDAALQARQAAVDAFQTDEGVRVFVGTLGAASTGITLTAARLLVFAEIDWVPATLQQTEDRIHRIGQQDVALIKYLVAEGSLEAYMAETVAGKLEVIEAALDGDVTGDQALQQELQAPVVPVGPRAASAFTRQPRLEITDPASHELARRALRIIASMDQDFAQQRNSVGFSKLDVRAGHKLALLETYTPAQAGYALRLAYRYRRQLPAELMKQVEQAYLEAREIAAGLV